MMHPSNEGNGPASDEIVVKAARDAARDACHLADLAGRAGVERHAEGAIEASLRASRAVFALEDAMRDPTHAAPLSEAVAALAAAEDALRAAREALEARVTRTLRPEPAKAARKA